MLHRNSNAWLLLAGLLVITTSLSANQPVPAEDEVIVPIGIESGIRGVLIVTAEEVVRLVDYDEETVLFDARDQAVRQHGHLQWSQTFDEHKLNQTDLAQSIAGKNTVVVFYGDKDSQKAAKAAELVARAGYNKVYWFKGGWPEWQAKGLKLAE